MPQIISNHHDLNAFCDQINNQLKDLLQICHIMQVRSVTKVKMVRYHCAVLGLTPNLSYCNPSAGAQLDIRNIGSEYLSRENTEPKSHDKGMHSPSLIKSHTQVL